MQLEYRTRQLEGQDFTVDSKNITVRILDLFTVLGQVMCFATQLNMHIILL